MPPRRHADAAIQIMLDAFWASDDPRARVALLESIGRALADFEVRDTKMPRGPAMPPEKAKREYQAWMRANDWSSSERPVVLPSSIGCRPTTRARSSRPVRRAVRHVARSRSPGRSSRADDGDPEPALARLHAASRRVVAWSKGRL
jgi:hypothetical protein